jgi:alkaline phosphatase
MYLKLMAKWCLLTVLVTLQWSCGAAGPQRAKNVILFLADGTGIPILHAARIYGYGKPQQLFYVQQMPHLGFAETSSASEWVTDSAAAMTAIMTGEKTHNGVVSQSAEAVRGEKDGQPLKTLLEYAEERGLSTGVVSNSAMSDATPAACYAHSNDRAKHGSIFAQILKPRFGDGVDVVIGPGRELILKRIQELDIDLSAGLKEHDYRFVDNQQAMQEAPARTDRLVALYGTDDFDLSVSVEKAIVILARNPRGFFLMVESNNHFRDVDLTLNRMVEMDKIIRRTAERMQGTDTLILFTADHSYNLRIPSAPKTQNFLPYVIVEGSHSAEEVLVAAQGPGAEKVKGMVSNTRLFYIMKEAYGW